MGASLLAIAVVQSTEMLEVPPSSRAGSLPQGNVVDAESAAIRDRLLECGPLCARPARNASFCP
ncbi:hypothetical protein CGA22_01735 [Pseudomonas sp. PSB18]|nr:hypothetical protein [Pseudomonas sp. PSB18]